MGRLKDLPGRYVKRLQNMLPIIKQFGNLNNLSSRTVIKGVVLTQRAHFPSWPRPPPGTKCRWWDWKHPRTGWDLAAGSLELGSSGSSERGRDQSARRANASAVSVPPRAPASSPGATIRFVSTPCVAVSEAAGLGTSSAVLQVGVVGQVVGWAGGSQGWGQVSMRSVRKRGWASGFGRLCRLPSLQTCVWTHLVSQETPQTGRSAWEACKAIEAEGCWLAFLFLLDG